MGVGTPTALRTPRTAAVWISDTVKGIASGASSVEADCVKMVVANIARQKAGAKKECIVNSLYWDEALIADCVHELIAEQGRDRKHILQSSFEGK